jgi:hypothetical protein
VAHLHRLPWYGGGWGSLRVSERAIYLRPMGCNNTIIIYLLICLFIFYDLTKIIVLNKNVQK